MAAPSKESVFCFDDIIVDAEGFRVKKSGQNINLTPRAFDVLTFLIKRGGRVVEKQEVFEAVWKDTFVSDNALTKIIKEIRHALEDPADNPRYIETVPKRGYRFIGDARQNGDQISPVLEENRLGQITGKGDEPNTSTFQPLHRKLSPHVVLLVIGLILISALAAWFMFSQKQAVTPPAPVRSIAVLPFQPLNADSRDESLEMGMAETLTTRLSNLKQIVVRPMSAVRKYTDPQQDLVKVGEELQVEAVLDGSIQKAGERVRVTVRLINVRTGLPIWSEQFDENFIDIFKVQDSIAERVTDALKLQISGQEKEQLAKHYTDNPEAYQLYLRGQLLWHRRRQNWIEQSLAYYQQALEKDPNFALAYIGAADAYIMLNGHHKMPAQETEANARPAIMKALEIDDTLALAHNALAELKYQYEYDWTGAEKEFKTAIDLNPNIAWIHQAYGWFLMSAGRFNEAATEMERARELDPNSLTINVGRGRLFYFSRQYDRAIQQIENIIAVEPNEDSSYTALATIYEQKQMYSEALETSLKVWTLNGTPPEKIEEFREAFRLSGWQGFLRKRLDGLEERAKTTYVNPYSFATLCARLGMKDEAFAYLEMTLEQRNPSILQIKIEPEFDAIRDDPRYVKLLSRIGLQP